MQGAVAIWCQPECSRFSEGGNSAHGLLEWNVHWPAVPELLSFRTWVQQQRVYSFRCPLDACSSLLFFPQGNYCPLHLAAKQGQVAACGVLIHAGALINALTGVRKRYGTPQRQIVPTPMPGPVPSDRVPPAPAQRLPIWNPESEILICPESESRYIRTFCVPSTSQTLSYESKLTAAKMCSAITRGLGQALRDSGGDSTRCIDLIRTLCSPEAVSELNLLVREKSNTLLCFRRAHEAHRDARLGL